MTAGQWLARAAQTLREAGIEDYKTDSGLFLCSVLGVQPGVLRFLAERPLTEDQTGRLDSMLSRRLEGEPEQYIEGEAWFMGRPFAVDARALIPRQDTETLCEWALNELKTRERPRVLDLCCGSGCIGISLKLLCPGAEVTLSDISPDAVQLARENAQKLGTEVNTICADGFEGIKGLKFDLIACNPPYLSAEDMDELQREVRFEPSLALYGGEDGLEFYRRFIGGMPEHLAPGGSAAFEVGQGQAKEAEKLLAARFPGSETGSVNDLNGIPRVVYVRT
ncbi:MAG: peptide chain release factor N(5)-glutamine methyltransferase [Clostridiales bacterium]|nr:peptide chain release factor N(5)-glutamine methyltransferase [Clostridiales bacterium]